MIKTIAEYNTMNELKYLSNYFNHDVTDNPDSDIASFINKTYDTMSNTDILSVVNKCMPLTCMKSLILKYELEHYIPDKINVLSLTEIGPIVRNILLKYTWKAGGFSIEDNEWLYYDNNASDYYVNVKDYEIIFTNTISTFECYSDETCEFLRALVKRLNNIANNIKVSLTYKEAAKITLLKLHIKDMTLRKHQRSKKISL